MKKRRLFNRISKAKTIFGLSLFFVLFFVFFSTNYVFASESSKFNIFSLDILTKPLNDYGNYIKDKAGNISKNIAKTFSSYYDSYTSELALILYNPKTIQPPLKSDSSQSSLSLIGRAIANNTISSPSPLQGEGRGEVNPSPDKGVVREVVYISGAQGPQGPEGARGPAGSSVSGDFVSRTTFDNQVDRILRSIENSNEAVSESVALDVSTGTLAVSSNATVGGNLTVTGTISGNVVATSSTMDTLTLGGILVLPTGTELNFVDGVTSNIQTQLDAKASIATPTFTTSITTPLVVGGTGTTQDLTFQTTSGVGATGADMHFLVGNNGATEAMTILNSGYVGVGTTAPERPFHFVGNGAIFERTSGDPQLVLRNTSIPQDWNFRVVNTTGAFTIRDATGTTVEAFTILPDSGNVGISTTAPQSLLDVQGPTGTGTATAGILTLATKELTIVDGDELGRINFNSPLESDGSDAILAGASIWAEADDTFSATVNSSELVFGTATTSAAVERMRIDSAGNVGIGTTAPSAKLSISDSSASENTPAVNITRTFSGTASNPIVTLLLRNTGDAVGGSDYQNEVHLRFQAGTTGDHRSYINFANYAGVDKWLTGRNALNAWILYDAEDLAHRMYLNSSANNGMSYINSVGTGAVQINNSRTGADVVGTGGFEVFNGGTIPSTSVFKVSPDDGNTVLTATSNGVGYAPASLLLKATQANYRGQGIFYYNQPSQTSWFSGVPYLTGTNKWMIGYKSSATWDSTVAQPESGLFTVQSNGNVGIGDTTPDALLDVHGTVCLDLNADDVCTDNTAALSDMRLKTNVTDMTGGLELVKQLRPVRFTWNGENNTGTGDSLGFLAQDVEAVFPELVITDVAGYKNLDYGKLTAVLTSAVQELDLKLNSFSGTFTPLIDSADVLNAKEKICIDGECLTKEDVKALLLLAHPPGSTPEPTPLPETTPPSEEEEPAPLLDQEGEESGNPEPDPEPELEPQSDVIPEPVTESTSEPEPTPTPESEPEPAS